MSACDIIVIITILLLLVQFSDVQYTRQFDKSTGDRKYCAERCTDSSRSMSTASESSQIKWRISVYFQATLFLSSPLLCALLLLLFLVLLVSPLLSPHPLVSSTRNVRK